MTTSVLVAHLGPYTKKIRVIKQNLVEGVWQDSPEGSISLDNHTMDTNYVYQGRRIVVEEVE